MFFNRHGVSAQQDRDPLFSLGLLPDSCNDAFALGGERMVCPRPCSDLSASDGCALMKMVDPAADGNARGDEIEVRGDGWVWRSCRTMELSRIFRGSQPRDSRKIEGRRPVFDMGKRQRCCVAGYAF
jgi:hypothetical protein